MHETGSPKMGLSSAESDVRAEALSQVGISLRSSCYRGVDLLSQMTTPMPTAFHQ
jgi:hypothetical protein